MNQTKLLGDYGIGLESNSCIAAKSILCFLVPALLFLPITPRITYELEYFFDGSKRCQH